MDFAESPTYEGPVFDLYQTAFAGCVDLTVSLPVSTPEGEVRDAFIVGLRSGAPDLTDEEADCLIDQLVANGIGTRQMVIAGYLPDQATTLTERDADGRRHLPRSRLRLVTARSAPPSIRARPERVAVSAEGRQG